MVVLEDRGERWQGRGHHGERWVQILLVHDVGDDRR